MLYRCLVNILPHEEGHQAVGELPTFGPKEPSLASLTRRQLRVVCRWTFEFVARVMI